MGSYLQGYSRCPMTYNSLSSLFHLFAMVSPHWRLIAKQALNLGSLPECMPVASMQAFLSLLHAAVSHELRDGITSRCLISPFLLQPPPQNGQQIPSTELPPHVRRLRREDRLHRVRTFQVRTGCTNETTNWACLLVSN